MRAFVSQNMIKIKEFRKLDELFENKTHGIRRSCVYKKRQLPFNPLCFEDNMPRFLIAKCMIFSKTEILASGLAAFANGLTAFANTLLYAFASDASTYKL